jgi:transcriptional regulator with XRE-family HTH domain
MQRSLKGSREFQASHDARIRLSPFGNIVTFVIIMEMTIMSSFYDIICRQMATVKEDSMRIRKPHDLGPLIRARRRALGWSQHYLARQVGVGRQWLIELEGGKSSAPLDLVIRTLDTLTYGLHVSDDTALWAAIEPGPSWEGGGSGRRAEPEAKPNSNSPSPGVFAIEGPVDPRDNSRQVDAITYQVTDFEGFGFAPDRDRLYDVGYRPILRRMAAHIIVAEAPIFEDLLARRIARAHGLARATRKLVEITQEIAEQKFARTAEGDRTIIWPETANARHLSPFRRAALSVRDHVDIPLVELASLAAQFLADGSKLEETAILMSRRIGLGRILPKTRLRLIEAAVLAQGHMSQ